MTSLEGACKIKSFINKGFRSRALDKFWQISISGMNRTKVIFRIESLNDYSKKELKETEKISKISSKIETQNLVETITLFGYYWLLV